MTLMIDKYRPVFAPEGEGGSDPAPVVAAEPAAPESVLFPSEGADKDKPAGDPDPAAGEKKDGEVDKPVEWKEYENDATKTEAENATAKAEHDKTKPAADPLDTVPEGGKYALTMPDGVTVDQELLDKLAPKFAAKNMTTREAQELADEFIAIETARGKARVEKWSETVNGWADTAKADKDIGGTKWDETVATSRRAVNTLGTPELKTYLESSGGGNHPEVIRFMAKVGSMIKEDSPANGGAEGAGKPADPAHILFPSDAPKGN